MAKESSPVAPLPPWVIEGNAVCVLHKTMFKGSLRHGGPEATKISRVTKTLIVLENGDRFPINKAQTSGRCTIFVTREKDSPHYQELIGPDHRSAAFVARRGSNVETSYSRQQMTS